jgi:hypothetical protein
MSTKKALPYVVLIPILLLSACAFGPPPSCGDNLGGTADTTKFDQYFTSMQLVDEADGQPGPEGENGAQFGSGDALAIQADAKSEVELRACIQPRGPGDIAFDNTQTMPAGQGTFSVGTFEAGPYVIRVIVEGVLVKNFPFEIK